MTVIDSANELPGGQQHAAPTRTASPLLQEICTVLRETADRLRISQRVIGAGMSERLGENWNQSRVWKLLWLQGPADFDALQACAECLGLAFADLIGTPRPGAGFILTEKQQRLFEYVRRHGERKTDALLDLLELPPMPKRRGNTATRNKAYEAGLALEAGILDPLLQPRDETVLESRTKERRRA